ncbi:Coatomer subunit delta-2 [Tetrabaena socialis]|uniref:Coatomer subunit delta n=1 Tax=Tetrabaena socialis TaxID=47790 RepID=A0A2J7ZT39_9CHLO|nr:Coatomer subunit delta-2 [Tetrabaena socialis]|eukprot:PNH03435.1 Coatomer subunit delta-2 [Tetrabaena socialis]
MVVLAAAIVSKTGKPLVSRQYMEMSRIRIEGLLAAFPKLVGTGKQHTYVETENVRYIYQPMEGLYLLLITNKQSNILEDLETLRLLGKLVPEFSQNLEEEAVASRAYELIFAFDEVISLGQKENITVPQVKQNCEMESHEEKLHKLIIQSKINDTKDIMKKKAADIEKSKMEQKKVGLGSALSGFGSKAASSLLQDLDPTPAYRPEPPPVVSTRAAAPVAKGPSKGMQLGKAKKANDFLESLAKEGEVVELDVPKPTGGVTAVTVNIASEPVSLAIEEKLSVSLNKQGGVENLEVQGTMSLVVNVDEEAFIRIAVTSGANKGFQFKTHPNIDKNLYSSANVLGLKDASRPFPTGSELGILKWRFQSKEESLVPLTINCWPSVSGGESFVNIEYESTSELDLQNVQIIIPLPATGHAPAVNQVDGEWRYDSRRSALIWSIELIDKTNRSGSLEFVTTAADAEAFYPVEVSFTSNKTFCDIAITSVEHTQKGGPVKFGLKKALETAEYSVV